MPILTRANPSWNFALDDYLCLTVLSKPGETEADFSNRLSRLWTHMLRNYKADFEKVYAETTEFDAAGACLSRMYLLHEDVISRLEEELQAAGLAFEPIDRDEVYSKYEAVPPEWMQIEH
jgi:hypothetical protein